LTQFALAFKSNVTSKIGDYLGDLYTAWQVEAIACGIALGLTLVFMVLLRLCAKVLVWLVFITFIVLLAVVGGFYYQQMQASKDPGDQLNYEILAGIFWGLDGMFVLVILVLYDDINLALTIIAASAQFTFQTIQILFIPFFAAVLVVGFLIYWIATAMFIYSIGAFSPYFNPAYPTVAYPIPNVTLDTNTSNLLYYHIVALFWILCFILGWVQFIVAATAAQWYFTSSSDQSGTGSVCRSTYWSIRYHIGSIAFGSLILAIVLLIKFIFEYMKVLYCL
jgi:hypothetical protein